MSHDDLIHVARGQADSIPLWRDAARAMRDAGYAENECSRPGGYSPAQMEARARECEAGLANAVGWASR
jgi:hypothetical protein